MVADSELQRIARLTPLADVLASFDIGVGAVEPREETVANALGKTLAADVVAPGVYPEAALALRDGYAVRADATTDATSYTPLPLSPTPPRIVTGERMPPDMDAVAPLDAIVMQGKTMQALAAVAPGEGVLPAGADAAPGVVLKMTGARLRRIDVAALLALGIERVAIREPTVRVIRAAQGKAIDAACELIATAIMAEGGWPVFDDMTFDAALRQAKAAQGAHAIIAIGGTGSGRNDQSVRTLERAGKVAFHGIGITPGETTAFGTIGARPVLLLPGRLDAALAGWLTVGRRMLARLAFRLSEEQPFNAELSGKIASPLRRLDPGACRQRRLSSRNQRAGEAVAIRIAR
jgi:molybdopterin molybdotransferase